MRNEIERKVERSNSEDRPDRIPSEDAEVAIGPWSPIEWNDVAGNPLCFLGGTGEVLNSNINSPWGIGDRFPRLGGHQTAEFLPPIIERPSDLLEEMKACVRRQGRHGRCRVDG